MFEAKIELIKKKILDHELGSQLIDLLNVGPKKPVAYLPDDFDEEYEKYISRQELEEYFESKGLKTKIFPPPDAGTLFPSFFVWDSDALLSLLKKNEKILLEAGWEVDADDFVRHIAIELVESKKNPDLYALVAYAFADFDNPFLKENRNYHLIK